MLAPSSRGIAGAEPLPARERKPVVAGAAKAAQTDASDGTPPSTLEWVRMLMQSWVGAARLGPGLSRKIQQTGDLRAAQDLGAAASGLGVGNGGGDDPAGVSEGIGEEATDGGQVDVAGARGPRLASEVEQEALHVLGRDRGRRSADLGEETAGAIRESVDGTGAEPRSCMWTFILSTDFGENRSTRTWRTSLAWVKARESPDSEPMDADQIPRDDVSSR